MSKKGAYDNDKVILVASRPSSNAKKYTEERMEKVTKSSQKVLRALKQIPDSPFK
ncbi:hypothetical protein [Bacillus cereus]|uniref:hypothetical protein n=1 Tax=Bacillus cereus TaxID=1396 RepID=UPI0018F62D06|nr:hypothetical protein [Bacillus cereus]MBJ7983002.1 hypothetical protein [Bacillus cereus]